jgi:hypothetical protein
MEGDGGLTAFTHHGQHVVRGVGWSSFNSRMEFQNFMRERFSTTRR